MEKYFTYVKINEKGLKYKFFSIIERARLKPHA